MASTKRHRVRKSRGRFHHRRSRHHSTYRRKEKRHSRRDTKRRRRKRTKRVKRGGTRKCMMKGGAYYVIKGDKLNIEINTGPPRAFSFGTTDAGAIKEKLNKHMPIEMQLTNVKMIDKGKEYSGEINGKYVTINKYTNAAAAVAAVAKDQMAKKIFSEQMAQARRNRAAEYKLQEIARGQAGMRPGAKYVSGEAAAADKYNPATREPEGQLQTPTTNFGPGAMRWSQKM